MDPRYAALDPNKFWERVLVVGGGGCWLWEGVTNPRNGYGQLSQRVDGEVTTLRGHRIAYEMFVGEVPEGLELDHLCRVRNCVRPDHLEAVTHSENVRRGESAERTRARHAAWRQAS